MSIVTHLTRRPVVLTAILAALLAIAVALTWWSPPQSGTAGAVGDGSVLAQAEDEDDEADDGEVAQLETLDVTYDVFLARDPFESIMPPEPVTDPTDPTDPDDPTDPTDPDDPNNGICQTNQEAVCDGRVVSVLEVEDDQATIEVDGLAYVVSPGQAFANNFMLIRIAGDECVDLMYLDGDEADIFRLCVGDGVAK